MSRVLSCFSGKRNFALAFVFLLLLSLLIAIGLPQQITQQAGSGTISTHHSLWNSYLGMVNILEINNSDQYPAKVELRFFQLSGAQTENLSFTLEPGEQRDIILNDLPSFKLDSYGIIEVLSESSGIDGRVSYYRPTLGTNQAFSGTSGNRFDYVFSAALTKGIRGVSSVVFNTHQPSLKSDEQQNLVANWLTLVNLDTENARGFSIEKRDQEGTLLSKEHKWLDPFQRLDYEAGHLIPGPAEVGCLRIIPDNKQAPYISQLNRYGYNNPSSSELAEFGFAFVLTPQKGFSGSLYLPIRRIIDHRFVSQNYLEVLNAASKPSRIEILLRTSSGEPLSPAQLVFELAPFAQKHIDVSDILAQNNVSDGTAEILASEGNSVISESMYYFRAPDGRMLSMFGSQAQEKPPLGQSNTISWNRFLGMLNFLTIINPNSEQVEIELEVWNQNQGISATSVPMPAHGSVTLALHDETYGTQAQSYGTLLVPKGLIIELLRVGIRNKPARSDSSLIDFVNLITPIIPDDISQDQCPEDPAKIEPGICGCGTADTDSDSDGTPDCNDPCPGDPNKTSLGICGCGTADTDSDSDGTSNCHDPCPNDAQKVDPGICGCGLSDADSDHDGKPDCSDLCPENPLKSNPGICGCSTLDIDLDFDGTPDCNDLCPNDPNKTEPGTCGCSTLDTDSDSDGTPDCNDICPSDPERLEPGRCGCNYSDQHLAWKVLYVAPGPWGNNRNEGSCERPFRTLEKAKLKVRELRGSMQGNILILIRGGKYNLERKLTLTEHDGGENDHFVIYKAFTNEEVIIQSVKSLRTSSWTRRADGVYWAEILDSPAPAVRELYFRGKRLTRARHPNPSYHKPKPSLEDRLTTGSFEKIIKWSLMGSTTCIEPCPSCCNQYTDRLSNDTCMWRCMNGDRTVNSTRNTAYVPQLIDGMDLQSIDPGGRSCVKNNHLEFVVNTSWAQSRLRIADLKFSEHYTNQARVFFCGEANALNFKYPPKHKEQPFYLENHLRFVDSPGEWYLDTDNSKIYLFPWELSDGSLFDPNVHLSNDELNSLYYSVLETLLTIKGINSPVEQLRFENLIFEHTSKFLEPSFSGYIEKQGNYFKTPADYPTSNEDYVDPEHPLGARTKSEYLPGGIDIEKARNLSFRNNTFRHLGGTGLRLRMETSGVHIKNNSFQQIGGHCIAIATDSVRILKYNNDIDKLRRQISRNDMVHNNRFSECGSTFAGSTAIQAMIASELTISDNQIFKQPYRGISICWGLSHYNVRLANVNSPLYLPEPIITKNKIINNTLSDNMMIMRDGSTITVCARQPETILSRNVVENQIRPPYDNSGNHPGVHALRMDDGTQEVQIDNNLIRNFFSSREDEFVIRQQTKNVYVNTEWETVGAARCNKVFDNIFELSADCHVPINDVNIPVRCLNCNPDPSCPQQQNTPDPSCPSG